MSKWEPLPRGWEENLPKAKRVLRIEEPSKPLFSSEEVYSVGEIARRLKMQSKTIRAWIHRDHRPLPATWAGEYRVLGRDVNDYLIQHRCLRRRVS